MRDTARNNFEDNKTREAERNRMKKYEAMCSTEGKADLITRQASHAKARCLPPGEPNCSFNSLTHYGSKSTTHLEGFAAMQ